MSVTLDPSRISPTWLQNYTGINGALGPWTEETPQRWVRRWFIVPQSFTQELAPGDLAAVVMQGREYWGYDTTESHAAPGKGSLTLDEAKRAADLEGFVGFDPVLMEGPTPHFSLAVEPPAEPATEPPIEPVTARAISAATRLSLALANLAADSTADSSAARSRLDVMAERFYIEIHAAARDAEHLLGPDGLYSNAKKS